MDQNKNTYDDFQCFYIKHKLRMKLIHAFHIKVNTIEYI